MTLTQTAILTKQIILISTIFLTFSTIIFIGYKIWYNWYISTLPPVEEQPNIKFGVLPTLDFPQSSVSSSNFSYSLDTPTGGLPKVGIDPGFEKIIKVYFLPKTYASFLSAQRSQDLAEKFAVKTPPKILSETNYQYKEDEKTLTVDLDSGNYQFLREATVSAKQKLDDDNALVEGFENTLSFLGGLKEELRHGRTKVVLLKNEAGKLVPTKLRSEALAAQISIWPQSIDKKSIFTADYNKSLVSATVLGSAANLENYLALNYIFFSIDTSTFATYPLRAATEAFEDLKSGKGVVLIEPEKPQVSITSVYLGYYLPENYTPYLQPIYIFEGPDFVAYTSAISLKTSGN